MGSHHVWSFATNWSKLSSPPQMLVLVEKEKIFQRRENRLESFRSSEQVRSEIRALRSYWSRSLEKDPGIWLVNTITCTTRIYYYWCPKKTTSQDLVCLFGTDHDHDMIFDSGVPYCGLQAFWLFIENILNILATTEHFGFTDLNNTPHHSIYVFC